MKNNKNRPITNSETKTEVKILATKMVQAQIYSEFCKTPHLKPTLS